MMNLETVCTRCANANETSSDNICNTCRRKSAERAIGEIEFGVSDFSSVMRHMEQAGDIESIRFYRALLLVTLGRTEVA